MLRLKLDQKSEKKLWRKVSELGVKNAAEKTGYPTSNIYNWKNKDLFIPEKFVKYFLENYIPKAVKTGSNSKVLEKPNLKSPKINELKTRIECSGFTNSEGTPFYYTQSRGNIQRFRHLINQMGAEIKVYRRNGRFEARYPIVIYEILSGKDFKPVKSALIDEKARVEEGSFIIENRILTFNDYGKLFNEDKLLQLGLQRSDPEIIGMVMGRESEKANSLL